MYFWDLSNGSRIGAAEYVDKKCIYTALAFAPARVAGAPPGVPSASGGCSLLSIVVSIFGE